MHQDQTSQASPSANFHESPEADPSRQVSGEAVVEKPQDTRAQMVIGNGLPATIGASAAMVIVGAPLVPVAAVGLASGLAFTLLRSRAQP